MQQVNTSAYRQDTLWRYIISGCGLALIVLTIAIGAFLCYKGLGTFTTYNHSISEFLFSADWAPSDSAEGGGKVGAAIFIFGSVITCALALAIATPFSLATAIFMTEISPELGKRFVQPAVEIFVGIPSVVYGWIGLTILVPLIKNIFNLRFGFSVLAAGIVLAVMIFPTITSLAADALRSIPKSYRAASYGLGATYCQGGSACGSQRSDDGCYLRLGACLRRSAGCSDGYRQDACLSELAACSDQQSDGGDCGGYGRCNGGQRIQHCFVDDGAAAVYHLPGLHFCHPLFNC